MTGASSGIGLHLAYDLVDQGFDVALVSRPSDRARRAVDAVEARAAGRASVSWHPTDLSSLAEVRRLGSTLLESGRPIDLLVLNAGTFAYERTTTVDGFEWTWAVNHLSPFLLSHVLAPAWTAAASPRIVVTSSGAEAVGEIDLERAASGVPYSAWRAYGWSKQANVHFARELARRAPHPRAWVGSFHPGFVATDFGAGPGLLPRLLRPFQQMLGRPPQRGARTGTWMATVEPPATPNGGFFFDEAERRPSSAGSDEAMTVELWARSEAWVELTDGERLAPPKTPVT